MNILQRPGLIGLIVIAVAGFWPLFAVAGGDDADFWLHIALFAAFGFAAYKSHRIGIFGLALVLLAHGLLDTALSTTHHPGPEWWPGFCAGYDVVLALALLASLKFQKAV